jgi:hypothetical protein
MKKSLIELKSIIEADINYNKKYMESAKNNSNPQVIEMYNTSKGRIEGLEAALEYIKTGSKIYFDKE